MFSVFLDSHKTLLALEGMKLLIFERETGGIWQLMKTIKVDHPISSFTTVFSPLLQTEFLLFNNTFKNKFYLMDADSNIRGLTSPGQKSLPGSSNAAFSLTPFSKIASLFIYGDLDDLNYCKVEILASSVWNEQQLASLFRQQLVKRASVLQQVFQNSVRPLEDHHKLYKNVVSLSFGSEDDEDVREVMLNFILFSSVTHQKDIVQLTLHSG